MRAKHLLCALMLSGLTVGCGDDTTSPVPTPADMAMPGDDGGSVGGDMAAMRTLADYVIDLIDHQTSATATPDDVVTHAAGLPDTQQQTDFAKYFP